MSRKPCSGFSECGTETRCRETTIAGKQGWVPADVTAEAMGLKGHTFGRIPEDCVGDLDLDVTRTNRVTGDA